MSGDHNEHQKDKSYLDFEGPRCGHCCPERTWVGLTDEEIDKAWRSCDYTRPWEQHRIDIARAIEAKLKEKNQ